MPINPQITQISQIKKGIAIGLRPHFFPQTTLDLDRVIRVSEKGFTAERQIFELEDLDVS